MIRRALFVLFVVLAVSAGALAQRRDDRSALERFREGWDRASLRPNVVFQGADGIMQAGVRCATRPARAGEPESVDRFVRARREAGDVPVRGRTTVPVVFHVVRTRGGKFNVSNQKIAAQMEVLNAAFLRRGFDFELEKVIRYKDNDFARRCSNRQAETLFKAEHAVDPATTLNVYTCRPSGGVLGWAWFPWDWPEDSSMHGVVMLYSSVPKGGATPYDEGDTLVHEVGHYLGLYHTFQGACGDRDRVDDTPAEREPTFGCPAVKDTCPDKAGADPTDNFMDYTDDACMLRFTKGQKGRMLEQAAIYRPTLTS